MDGHMEGAAEPLAEPTFELEHAIGFSGTVRDVLAAHPNGQDLIYAAGGCVVACDKRDPHKQTFFRGHDADITCLSVSPSGRIIASGQGGAESDVIVWDYDAKSVLFRCEEHRGGVAGTAITPDEKLMATLGCDTDNQIIAWDISTGHIVATASVPSAAVAIAWGGHAKDVKRRETDDYILATAGNQSLTLWELNPFAGVLTPHTLSTGSRPTVRDYTCVEFSPDGDWLFAGSSSGDFSVFSVRGKSLKAIVPACSGGVRSITVVSADQVLVGGGDGTLTDFYSRDEDKISWADRWQGCFDGGVTSSSCIDADGEFSVYVGTAAGQICRAVPLSDAPGEVWGEAHFGGISAVGFHKGVSDAIATCSSDCTIRVWDLNDYHVKWMTRVQVARGIVPTCLVWAVGCVFTGWSDGRIRCHDVHSALGSKEQMLWVLDGAHASGVTAIAMSESEKFFVTGGEDGEIRLWDIKSRELVSNLKEHNSRVSGLALCNDHVHALSCSRDRSIFVWDLRSERHVASNLQRMGGINALALHPNNTNVLSVGQEKKITYWELNRADPVRLISPAHDGEALCIVISHNGKLFATGGTDDMVKLWNMATGRLLADGVAHSGPVLDLQFSPDDRQLVSVGEDGNAMVWNIYMD